MGKQIQLTTAVTSILLDYRHQNPLHLLQISFVFHNYRNSHVSLNLQYSLDHQHLAHLNAELT
jgi:hypothetical protein